MPLRDFGFSTLHQIASLSNQDLVEIFPEMDPATRTAFQGHVATLAEAGLLMYADAVSAASTKAAPNPDEVDAWVASNGLDPLVGRKPRSEGFDSLGLVAGLNGEDLVELGLDEGTRLVMQATEPQPSHTPTHTHTRPS